MKSTKKTSLLSDGDSGIDDSKNASMGSHRNTTRTISSAGYDFCGEPLFAQHLTLDFTPIEGVDSECVSKKVCSFWDFIHATPEIKNLMVKPDQQLNLVAKKSTSANLTETIHPESEGEDQKVEKTAVEYLQFANEKGMLDGTRVPKSRSHDTMGAREYPVGEIDAEKNKKAHVCTCANTKSTCCTYPMKSASGLSQTLTDWDAKHNVRKMDPPGHPPSLHHSIMQRQVPD